MGVTYSQYYDADWIFSYERWYSVKCIGNKSSGWYTKLLTMTIGGEGLWNEWIRKPLTFYVIYSYNVWISYKKHILLLYQKKYFEFLKFPNSIKRKFEGKIYHVHIPTYCHVLVTMVFKQFCLITWSQSFSIIAA